MNMNFNNKNKKKKKKKGFTTESMTHNWPMVVLKLDGRVNNNVDFQHYTEEWSKLYLEASERKERFKLIFDVRNVKKVDVSYLYGQAKYLLKVKQLTELWMDRTAVLVSSGRIKKMIHFVFKFYKPVRPFKVFLEHEEEDMYNWINSNDAGEEIDVIDEIPEEDMKKYVDFDDRR